MSPGPLSQAHQSLDTPLQCGACHAVGKGSAQFKCLDCHEEIRRRLIEKRGYHARIVKGSGVQAAADCARCHAEHNGRQHQLVRWRTPKTRFDHGLTGWALEGKHAPLACEKCHNAAKMTREDRTSLKRNDLGKSYLGLSALCSNCHVDEHRGDLGPNCSRCHSQDSWKNPPGFSHDKSAFPLTGLHQKVACAKCHPGPLFTDLTKYDVGTTRPFDSGVAIFDTTSLVELWRSPPYLHDGGATTVRQVLVEQNRGDTHGVTSKLSPAQIDDLVAFLLSL